MGAWVKRSRRANTYGDKGNLRALLSALDSTSKLVYDPGRSLLRRMFFLVSYMPLALEAAGRRICAHYEHASS